MSAAGDARDLVSNANAGALATISDHAGPWSSLVAYADLRDGSPVLCISTLAEHGRNLQRNPKASLLVCGHQPGEDPLATPRVTLAGHVHRPHGDLADAARIAFLTNVPGSEGYVGFGDFTMYVLHVKAVRWVGGYGRMETVNAADYAAANIL